MERPLRLLTEPANIRTNAATVWDQSDDPPALTGEVLRWRSYAQSIGTSSVPRYLEAHADRIRSKYLAFIHDLGETLISGRRVVDHLDHGDGFSFWWMTTIAEKSPLKSPRIYDCLRLFALEEMLVQRVVTSLTLVSSDRALALAMRAMCRNLNVEFAWQRREYGRKWSLRRIYLALPYVLKALLSVRHVVMRWPLRKAAHPGWFSEDGAIFICSYFIHLDPSLCAQGKFHSRQWECLPKLLHDTGRRTNWIQLFLFSAAVPTVERGLSWLRGFNGNPRTQGCHAFLESYLSVGVVRSAVRNWLWLCAVSWRLRHIGSAFRPKGSALLLWPLLRDDWLLSLSGQIGLANSLAVAQFDAAFADVPHQHTGLYLFENQAWEKALLRAWHKYKHGRILGVQHSTAPFWHLYNFDDPRSLIARNGNALPIPDLLAVNGAVPWQAFVASGYPEERLVQVEALRYLNLSDAASCPSAIQVPIGAGGALQRSPKVAILILGDMIASSMRHLLGLIDAAMKLLPSVYALTFKPHPGYQVNLADYPGMEIGETSEPLAKILSGYDVAIAANSTSASVEAYLTGLPVIIGLDGDELNLSPLRGQPTVRFVCTPEDLAEAIQAASRQTAPKARDRDEFFFLDPDLPRWRQLIAAESHAS